MNQVPLLLARSVALGGEITRHPSPNRRAVNVPVTATVDLACAVMALDEIARLSAELIQITATCSALPPEAADAQAGSARARDLFTTIAEQLAALGYITLVEEDATRGH